jgi:hypothetical protein
LSYQYTATEDFWKHFHELPDSQKLSVRNKWKNFKADPFHPSLGTHKIHRLSALYRHPIYSVVIEGNLRVLFRIDQHMITTLEVGTHDVYQ